MSSRRGGNEQAVTRASEAEQAELAAVYEQHHDFVWRSLLRLGVPPHDVDDVVHDVFVVAARRLPRFEGRSAVTTWLFAVAMRVALHHRRGVARHLRRTEAYADALGVEEKSGNPHLRNDAAYTLHRLLDVLDDDKRAVFILIELEGFTAAQAAEIVGAKPATVQSRLRLARQQLQREIHRIQAAERRSA